MSQCGIAYGSANSIQYLPLVQLNAQVQIVDVSARVTLTQIYENPSDSPTPRAKYKFPIPASAAICAFEMETSDGRRVIGICKDSETAKEEYEAALASGRQAGLVETVSDDIFTISVGSIFANSTAETKLTYVITLMNDDIADSVRFSLPMCIGERYGVRPTALEDAASPSHRTRVRLSVDIQMPGIIRSIRSPSHDDSGEITVEKYDGTSKRRSRLKLRSREYLDKEFVLIVEANKLDAPRCFAETRSDDGPHYTMAAQFTVVPKYSLPPAPAKEFLFLIDRSGSMAGARIETAKKTLSLLLRMLPAEGTSFNVILFDNLSESFWPQSQGYNSSSLADALQRIDFIQHGGGTEIAKALSYTISVRASDKPTAIFVLTDGEVWDPIRDESCSLVREAVLSSPLHCPLQLFALAVGSDASTDLCESIAKAGNGTALSTLTTEDILIKCSRLLTSGKAQSLKDISVDWGVPNKYLASRSTLTLSVPGSTTSRRLPVIQQSPPLISNLYAGSRFCVYVIITVHRKFDPLRHKLEVTLRGKVEDSGKSFSLSVPIKGITLKDGGGRTTRMIHSLAAWKLIQDHQDGSTKVDPLDESISEDEFRKAAVVALGGKYQVASKHTSFVAVDPDLEEPRAPPRMSTSSSGSSRTVSTSRMHRPALPYSMILRLGDMLSNIFSLFGSSHNTRSIRRSRIPGAFPVSRSSSQTTEFAEVEPPDDESDLSDASIDTFSTLSSLFGGGSDWSDWSHERRGRMNEGETEAARSPSPIFNVSESHTGFYRAAQTITNPEATTKQDVMPEVVELLKVQTYDGSFSLEDVKDALGDQMPSLPPLDNNDDRLWATAISVAFILKLMGDSELSRDLMEKSIRYLRHHGEERLLSKAREVMTG